MSKKSSDPAVNLWLTKFAEALEAWIIDNHYKSKAELAKELNIPLTQWGDLASGRHISNKGHYAKIYHRTGLSEADPRRIPAKKQYHPSGSFYDVPRAMTEEEWQEWLKAEENQIARDMVKPGIASSQTKVLRRPSVAAKLPETTVQSQAKTKIPIIVESMLPTIGSIFGVNVDRFVEVIARQIGQVIAEDVGRQLGRQIALQNVKTQDSDISRIARQLAGLLKSYLEAEKKDRDLLIAQYGQDLASLLSILDPLLLNPEQRENALRLRKQLKGG